MTLEPWTVPITVSSHSTLRCCFVTWRQITAKTMSEKGGFALLFAQFAAYSPSVPVWCFSINSHLPLYPIQNNDRPGMQLEWNMRGVYVVEDRNFWAEEGGRVNYSIIGWLSQELFKQAPVSRGLGLITPAKVTPTTLPHCRLLWVCLIF